MNSLKAVVKNGRLVVDEPTDLADGTVVELYVDVDADLTPAELAKLGEHMSRCQDEEKAGNYRPAREFLAELRASR